jgi:hypothetical protein
LKVVRRFKDFEGDIEKEKRNIFIMSQAVTHAGLSAFGNTLRYYVCQPPKTAGGPLNTGGAGRSMNYSKVSNKEM